MNGQMGPVSTPSLQRQEQIAKPEDPPPAAASKTPATSSMEGMTGAGMEHPATSVPFYRERTFLALVGVAVSAAGFLGYRVARSRTRRRGGPASFVTEAVLVVDLVGSTHLATHYGDGFAMKARTILKDRIMVAAQEHGLAFAENTGDGYFMTFSSVVGAVQTAIAVLQTMKQPPPDLSPGSSLDVRAGISYGGILLDAKGHRHGAVINRAFRLEGLTREGFAQIDGGLPPDEIPDRNRIFLDEEAAQEVRAAGITSRFVGFCSLKGFSGLHRVYAVLWETQG
jgi:class 3 adenylate cyclase